MRQLTILAIFVSIGWGDQQTHADEVPVIQTPESIAAESSDMRSKALLAEVVPTIQAFVDARMAPGITVAVTTADKTLMSRGIGWRSLEPMTPLSGEDAYWIASITKPLSATAFMMLVDEGLVDLDDPVSKYLPSFEKTKTADGKQVTITIRHCLTHTSGVNSDRKKQFESLEEFVVDVASRETNFEPGSEWRYSSSLDVIARIAETVTQMPFEDFIKQRLFDPLGMVDTTFNMTPDQAIRYVVPTTLNEESGGLENAQVDFVSADPTKHNWPRATGGAFSTIGDLTKFARFVMNGGKVGDRSLLSERAIEAMTSLQTGELKTGWTPGNGWGLGWCVVRYPQHVTRSLSSGSFGHGGAYGPQLWIDKKLGVAYIVLFERKDIGNSDGSDIREAFQVSASRAIRRSATAGGTRD